jgi:hypothetical protein
MATAKAAPSKLATMVQTSEFWMSLLFGLAGIASAFGFDQAKDWVEKFGPIIIGLILQRVLSKSVKGEVPFTAPPSG